MARTVKRWLVLLAAVSLLLVNAVPAAASPAPYESYNYNYWKEAVPSPDAYLPERTISGRDLGISEFKDPGDVNVSASGLIYILDSGNNRIIVLDTDFKLLRVMDGFMMEGSRETFNLPGGLFVDEEERIYVADTGNSRVVVMDGEGTLIHTITKPESDILATDFQFQPLKLTVDHVGRVYVVAQGVYEGIMQFDENGQFIGYVGTYKVERDYGEYIWRMLSTKAQRAQMVLFVPTEFSNADMDHKGFVYATNIDPGSNEPIKRLNPSGEDVLKRFGYVDVRGDIRFRSNPGPSKLIDVKVLGNGMYSVLDATQNRVFTYDDEGHLLYIYGGKGNQVGTLKTPVALEQSGNHHLVLDRGKNNLVVYEPTRFGARVNEAVALHYQGEDTEAVNIWREVLKLNANYDIAYIGIGKSLLMEKKNEEALGYFELGMDRKSYSVAFKRHRREMMKEHFGTFLTTALALIFILILTRVGGGRLNVKQDYIKFPLHLIFHPIDAFWDMKSDNRGRLWVAFSLLALTIIMMTLQKQYAGFLVNYIDPRTINTVIEIITVAVPFVLWCTANWAVTTLMEGEGKFREIVLATGYSLIPVILIYAPMIIISRFMVQEETAFYYLFNSIAFFWFVLLLFIGMMTVHQYTVIKTILTMLLTLIVMGIIVFHGALVFSMLQQLYEFGYNIYRELIFRT